MNKFRLQILHVEHRPDDALLLQRMLAHAPEGVFEVRHAATASEAMIWMGQMQFDGVILNLDQPHTDPFDVLLRIRNLDPRLAILVLTDCDDEDFGLRTVECGAQDFIAKDLINGQLLYRAMRYGIARQRQISHFKTAAHTDALTGLANRRALDQALNDGMREFLINPQDNVFILLDIDRFKQFNDQHGHRAGDYVLSETGSLFRDALPSSSFIARYGGEEFGILLPNTTIDQAVQIVRTLLDELAANAIEFEGKQHGVTASAGLTMFCSGDTVGSVIERADIALYEAKTSGRSRGKVHLKTSVPISLTPPT